MYIIYTYIMALFQRMTHWKSLLIQQKHFTANIFTPFIILVSSSNESFLDSFHIFYIFKLNILILYLNG